MTAVAVSKRDAGSAIQSKILVDWAEKINGLAYRDFDATRMAAAFAQAATKEPKLLEATPASLYIAITNAAKWGLDIGEGVYLVPINSKVKGPDGDRWETRCEAWPSYHGLKHMAMRQNIVRLMEEYVVYAGDDFDYQLGTDGFLRHRPCAEAKRGQMVGAYTIITLRFGAKTWHYMPIGDIELIRAKSKSWGPKYIKDCPPWYAMKTVARSWLNRQPKSGAIADALKHDDVPDGEAVDVTTGEVIAPNAEHKRLVAASQQEAPGPIDEEAADLALDAELAAAEES